MERLTTISDDMYNKVHNKGILGRELRKLLGIPETKKVHIGDTMCLIGEPCAKKDVFKCSREKSTTYYVVIEPTDGKMAFCYSINVK